MPMRTNNRHDDDYEAYDDDCGVILQEVVPMQIIQGYVAIPEEKYEALVGAMQRMVILAERLTSGERLSKSMILRALGMFEDATAESLCERYKKENT